MDRTTVQRIPYPLGLDGANGARQLQDTAEYLETKFVDLDMRWFYRNTPSAWQTRTSATDQTITGTFLPLSMDSVDFDNRGNLAPINTGSNTTGRLGNSGDWEHWYIGAYLNFTGMTTLGDPAYAQITVAGIDPLTHVSSVQRTGRAVANSNTSGGEHLVVEGFFRVRDATVQIHHVGFGAGTKLIAIGALFWAVQVGVE